MRIYLKLHFIHFKEKTWQFKDVQHQLKVLLTFSCLCGQKSAKWTRRPPLPYSGWNLCPEARCAKGQWETRKISISSLDMLFLGSAWGKASVWAAQMSHGGTRHCTHILQLRDHLPAKRILIPLPHSQGAEWGPIGLKEPHLVPPVSITQHCHRHKSFVAAAALWN